MIKRNFKDRFKLSLLLTTCLLSNWGTHVSCSEGINAPTYLSLNESSPNFIFSIDQGNSSPAQPMGSILNQSKPIQDHPREDFQATDWKASEQDPDFLFDPNILQNYYHPPTNDDSKANLSSAKSKLYAIIENSEENSSSATGLTVDNAAPNSAQAQPAALPAQTANPLTVPANQTPQSITPSPVIENPQNAPSPIYQPSTIAPVGQPQQPQTPGQPERRIVAPPHSEAFHQSNPPATDQNPGQPEAPDQAETPPKTISINFNNVSIVELIRFVSRISNKNFVFDENDLQFTVTIVSEEPTTVDNIVTALLQELRIHELSLMEQGNNIIIHRNPKAGYLSPVVTEDQSMVGIKSDVITKVFRLNTVEADKAAGILKPMLSDKALVEVLPETNHLIITDITANINEISRLLKSIDSPQSGLVIGQYVVRNAFMDSLIVLGEKIMQPISREQTLIFVPHAAANSIFIVSTPYLVERTISVLQYLDQNQGTTRILNPKDMRFQEGGAGMPGGGPHGQWELDTNGNWQFKPQLAPGIGTHAPPDGRWVVDPQGNWYFQPGAPGEGGRTPEGNWVKNTQGVWVFQLRQGQSISPQRLTRSPRISAELPVGHIERIKFYIHKLRYRNGDQIARALSKIAESLQITGTSNEDLVSAINSVQWLEGSNSLVVTGNPESIEKVRELIDEIDTPLRQVFLEMLIMECTIDDNLQMAVNPGARFGGGLTAGSEEFVTGASTLNQLLSSGAVTTPTPPFNTSIINQIPGFTAGVVGMHLSFGGKLYATLGAFVSAIHTKSTTNVITNPKILTEDNNPAEIFVGINTQFPTQSISNDLGSIVTQNFEFRDVGTRLKVTPLISNNDIITLDIQEEVSRVISGGTTSSNLSNQVIGPTTSVSRTTTKVHVPNRYFLVLSANMQDTINRERTQLPCVGGIPIIGGLFSDKRTEDVKSNIMIFIRPEIVDSEEQIRDLTKRQQDIFRLKRRRPTMWKFEVDESLDFLNLEDTDDAEGEYECY